MRTWTADVFVTDCLFFQIMPPDAMQVIKLQRENGEPNLLCGVNRFIHNKLKQEVSFSRTAIVALLHPPPPQRS